MRSPSVEGGDTITLSERGPLGPGGAVEAEVPHFEAGVPFGGGRAEGTTKLEREAGYVGIGLKPPWEPGRVTAELAGARCLKPYWGKPTVRNFREGGWKRDYGSRTEAQRESFGIATEPYGARASALPDGAKSADVRDPQSVFMRMYRQYVAQFADIFRDETALLGVSAAGERDDVETSHCGGAPFVNAVHDAFRARDPNHLFLCEPHFDLARDPNYYRKQGWKSVLGGTGLISSNSWIYPRKQPRRCSRSPIWRHPSWLRVSPMIIPFSGTQTTAGGAPWTIQEHGLYRLRLRQDLYTGLAYRVPLMLTWDEYVVEDERVVFEQVRRLVDWSGPFRVPSLAIRVGQKLLPPHRDNSRPLWQCEIALSAYPLETVYVWEDEPAPAGVLHTVDARHGLPKLAFASAGGSLPNALKNQMPLRLPEGMTANYSWSVNGAPSWPFCASRGRRSWSRKEPVRKNSNSRCRRRFPNCDCRICRTSD